LFVIYFTSYKGQHYRAICNNHITCYDYSQHFDTIPENFREVEMATATTGKRALATQTQKQEIAVEVAGPSRREFLYYIWGASIVLLLGQAGAGLIWFSLPRFREGEFGGIFRLNAEEVPPSGDIPQAFPSGRFWASNTDQGFLALYAVCTHLGCLPKWVDTSTRFECPCHGSKFEADGEYIEGPAPRGMDRFAVTITFTNGEVESTDAAGAPIPLRGREIAEIAVDTGNRILGT
jgi:cytochrome b6-f complex iron-sulfur subunit